MAGPVLGVTGTIIGAAVVSTSATTGAAVFQHAFRRTGEGIRRRVPAVAMALTPSEERASQRVDPRAAFALPDDTPAGDRTPTTNLSEDESVTTYRTGSQPDTHTARVKRYGFTDGRLGLAVRECGAGHELQYRPGRRSERRIQPRDLGVDRAVRERRRRQQP